MDRNWAGKMPALIKDNTIQYVDTIRFVDEFGYSHRFKDFQSVYEEGFDGREAWLRDAKIPLSGCKIEWGPRMRISIKEFDAIAIAAGVARTIDTKGEGMIKATCPQCANSEEIVNPKETEYHMCGNCYYKYLVQPKAELLEKNYRNTGENVGALVDEKNVAYGEAFSKTPEFLKILYPNGVAVEQYADMLGLVRDFDKSMRIATAKDALGENPWRDKAGYGILMCGKE